MTTRRSYMSLGIFLARRPEEEQRIELTLSDIQGILSRRLPERARYPSWWRNDARTEHSRAWRMAGWRVAEMDPRSKKVVFERSRPPRRGVER